MAKYSEKKEPKKGEKKEAKLPPWMRKKVEKKEREVAMDYHEFLMKYSTAENHFDVFLSSLTTSPISIVLFVLYSGGLVALGHFL